MNLSQKHELHQVYINLLIQSIFHVLLAEQNSVTAADIITRCRKEFPQRVVTRDEVNQVLLAEGCIA